MMKNCVICSDCKNHKLVITFTLTINWNAQQMKNVGKLQKNV